VSRYPACRVRGRGIDDATQAAAQGAAGPDAPGTALRAEHISASAASMLRFGVLCPQLARADISPKRVASVFVQVFGRRQR